MRTINAAGLALIKHFEGLRLTAYADVGGTLTIGYGHTRGVWPGMAMTEPQAERALLDDLLGSQAVVEDAIHGYPATDNQFAALVSLEFNIGAGNFRASTVLRNYNSGRLASMVAAAFMMWNKTTIDGHLQVVAGLTLRRLAEQTLYLT